MTYSFKLSRRMARFRAAVPTIAATLLILACGDNPSGPGSDTTTGPANLAISPDSVSVGLDQAVQFDASVSADSDLSLSRTGKKRGRPHQTVVGVTVAPETTSVKTNASNRFSATAELSDGTTMSSSLSWSATGGTIDQTGLYTAGKTAGKYRVIAAASNGLADTADVFVASTTPTAVQVILSPALDTVFTGTNAQFTLRGKAADGSTVAVAPAFAATGGTITSAGLFTAGQNQGTYRVIATDQTTGLADTAAVTIIRPVATIQSLSVSPATVTLVTAKTQQFAATERMSDGSTSSVTATWTATGGTISSSGLYTAGQTPGSYRVIGADTAGRADTAAVTITAASPTLQAVVLTPTNVSLQSGATQSFAASGRMSDGSTSTVNVTYSATGGTITSAGLYTAGATGGSFRVVATLQGGSLADTAAVTVTSTPTSPPPSASCGRTVNVSSVSQLTSAVGGAQPGDCISLAPGTYGLTSTLALNRSGTSSSPIIIQGAGSSTVIDVNQTAFNVSASYLQLRKMRITDFGVSGIYLSGATYNVFDSLEVDHGQYYLFTLKDGSHHNTIKNSHFHDSGINTPQWGEAVYIGNSGDSGHPLQFTNTDNRVLDNYFGPAIRSEAIDNKEGSDRTLIQGNVFDGTNTVDTYSQGSSSLVAIIGSNVTIDGNQFKYGRPNGVVFYAPKTVTMVGNVVSNNDVDLRNILSLSVTEYAFNLTVNTNSTSHVVVKCNNTVTNGAFSNVSCSP